MVSLRIFDGFGAANIGPDASWQYANCLLTSVKSIYDDIGYIL